MKDMARRIINSDVDANLKFTREANKWTGVKIDE